MCILAVNWCASTYGKRLTQRVLDRENMLRILAHSPEGVLLAMEFPSPAPAKERKPLGAQIQKMEIHWNMQTNIARLLGYWSSIFIAILGGIYLLLLIFYFSTAGFIFPPTPLVQLVGGVVTFLTAPGLLILFTAIRFVKEENNNVLGSLGVSFMILFSATVSINRFVQLTVIQQSLPDVPTDLTRFMPYSTGSVMFALEMLGWGFFSSLAAVFVAPLFSSSPLNNAIRWLFILYAVFSFMSVIGFATNTPITAGAFIAWGPILLALSILLARYFQNIKKG